MFNLDGRTFGAVTFDTEQRPGARRDYKQQQQHKAEGRGHAPGSALLMDKAKDRTKKAIPKSIIR